MIYRILTIILFLLACKPGYSQDCGIITTVAGNGNYGYNGDGIPATSAELWGPVGIALDSIGNIFVADQGNNRIRIIAPSDTIYTFAGNGTAGDSGDNAQATIAELKGPAGVAVDAMGNILIADYINNKIRKVTPSGIISTIAGNGIAGHLGDGGPATLAELNYPANLTIDTMGNIIIADYGNNRIRKVNTLGIITTVAGNGTYGFSGDGGPAVEAEFELPSAVAVDLFGNIYIADVNNNRIRVVDTAGIINTFAGGGTTTLGDGGPATSAFLREPHGVAVDIWGDVFIADTWNFRIRQVTSSGIINTIAGNGMNGYSGDGGQAIYAELDYPWDVAIDKSGDLYIVDNFSNTIRVVDICNAGVSTIVNDSRISIFPNPALDECTLVTNAKPGSSYAIINSLGVSVQSGIITLPSTTINLEHLAQGVYLLLVKSNDPLIPNCNLKLEKL